MALVFFATAARGADQLPLPEERHYVFHPLPEELGLDSQVVTALVQDPQGFIWIGTLEGLFRFDGAQVARFDEELGLPSSYIFQLVVSPQGILWAGTREGVAYFDGMRFRTPAGPAEARQGEQAAPPTQHMAFAANDDLYLATPRGILLLPAANRSKTQLWSEKDGLPAAKIQAIHGAPDGTIWFGCANRVGTFDPVQSKIEILPPLVGIEPEPIAAIITAPDGAVWVCTRYHLFQRPAGATAFSLDKQKLPITQANSLPGLDSPGNLLVPSREGLFYRRHRGWKQIGTDHGLPTEDVLCVLEDHEGALWLGTGGVGVARWPEPHRWSAWTTAEGLPSDTVWSILRDSRGRLWVGTAKGVAIWDPQGLGWQVLREKDGIAGQLVWQLTEDRDGVVWASSGGVLLTRFDPETMQPLPVTTPANFKDIYLRMQRGPDGRLLIGGEDFLATAKVQGGEVVFENVDTPDQVRGCLKCISVTSAGTIWASGRKGVARFDGSSWRRFTTADGLRKNEVELIAARSSGEAWFVYADLKKVGQISLSEGQAQVRVRHLGKDQGLPSDAAYLVGVDAWGRVWTGGNKGVSVIDETYQVQTFNREDGLIWDDLSGNAFFAETDGSVFIGTSRGLAHFDPAGAAKEPVPPKVVLTSTNLGGQELLGEKEPQVAYEDGTFAAQFSGLTFRQVGEVLFRYRLVGLEDELLETKQRAVRYPTLAAGQYRFEVACRSAGGLWSKDPAVFSFSVLPPWWETWWLRLSAILALVLLVLVVVKLRTRTLEADRRKLEQAVAQRSAELAQRSAELAQANDELKELSFTDVLTNIRNRRYFMNVIADDVSRAMRKHDQRTSKEPGRNISLIFYVVDLDRFKRVNDTYGHLAGDKVLNETARRLTTVIRTSDLLVRWGGEEFLIVCRDAEPGEAAVVAERILETVGSTPIELDDKISVQRTCSVGWAAYPWLSGDQHALSYEAVLELADKGLLLAKESGRNQGIGVQPQREGGELPASQEWITRSLLKLEGSQVDLVRVAGPEVDGQSIPPASGADR